MAASTVQFSFAGQLNAPVDEGQPVAVRPFGLSSQFSSENTQRLSLTGAGSVELAFGSLGSPGAKGMLIEYLPSQGAAPVQITFNSGSDDLELSPGGFLAYGSPNPVTGILSLEIAYTADCTIRIWLAG